MLPRLTTLPLLALLPLLPLLPLLATRALLPLLTLHLFHVALQLFRLAPQHLLLPAFLERLRLIPLLLRQLLLPLRQRVQFRQRVVHLLRLLFRRRSRLRRLVLILFGVHFQIEEARQIATRASTAASTATAALPEGHLNLAESRLCTQQRLQHLLLNRHRLLPLHRLQFVGRRLHPRGGLLHILVEGVELLVCLRQIAALHARAQRQRLLFQRGLRLAQRLAHRRSLVRATSPLVLISFHVAAINSFSRRAISPWLFCCPPPPPPPPPPPCCDCENSRSNGST